MTPTEGWASPLSICETTERKCASHAMWTWEENSENKGWQVLEKSIQGFLKIWSGQMHSKRQTLLMNTAWQTNLIYKRESETVPFSEGFLEEYLWLHCFKTFPSSGIICSLDLPKSHSLRHPREYMTSFFHRCISIHLVFWLFINHAYFYGF